MARRVIQLAILYALVLVLAPTDADGRTVSRGRVSMSSPAAASLQRVSSGTGARPGRDNRTSADSA